ncbi:uridine kinase family protein [Bailinhaonella thermotolerans]|uniref:(d)CMP kinase n=1 Tax=Bailinhaonella thermotolerans TaxID=1070861 RepID=A0A3A4ASK6_9ACTN|nr:hypothetical protein [Bailinhaonella thermotolerans]RJL31305.1 hypothetical protein D5H75_19845 [Bailinhaonella thermotolerans]
MGVINGAPGPGAVLTYSWLAGRVRALPPSCGPVRLVAVDGPGGSGKTTFAGRLGRELGARVVHSDDFPVAWDDPVSWFGLLETQVLAPLERGEAGRFRRWDWPRGEYDGPVTVPPDPVLVVEGVSTARRSAAGLIALAVWVEAPRELRLRRALARDGEEYRAQWETWVRAEDTFFAADGTRSRADLLVDGDPRVPHDPEKEFVLR